MAGLDWGYRFVANLHACLAVPLMFKANHIRGVRLPYIYQAGWNLMYHDQVDHLAIAEVAASASEIHGEI